MTMMNPQWVMRQAGQVCVYTCAPTNWFVCLLDEHQLKPWQETLCEYFLNELVYNEDYCGGLIGDDMGLGKTGTFFFIVFF
jgi:hypothetical protein